MTDEHALKPTVTLDMRGTSCPAPLLGAKKIVDDLRPGQVLLLYSDCPGTHDDLFAWSKYTDNEIARTERLPDGGHAYYIRRGRGSTPTPNAVLDLRGVVCPGPLVEAKRLLNSMQSGRDAEARQQLPRDQRRHHRLGEGDRVPAARDRRGRRRANSSSTSARRDAHQEPLVQGRDAEDRRRRSPAPRRSSSGASRRTR